MHSRYNTIFLIGLCFIIGITFYYALGIYGLADNNEGLYAEISKEMFVSHHYIISTLNSVPYIEKPPLLYWLISSSFHLWGVNEFAARFVPATCGALTCLSLVFFTWQINRLHEGMLAALILSTSLGFVLIARIVFFDMLLTAMFSFSLMSFYLAWFFRDKKSVTQSKWYVRSAYFFLALATLTKSLVALCLVPAIGLAFLISTKSFKKNYKLFLDPIALCLFFLTVLPWHILAVMQHPGFFQQFFINEQWLRFLDKRIPHDYYSGPIYYYLLRVLVYLLPWGMLLPFLALKRFRENTFRDPLKLFSWLWFLIPLIFFSLSKAKANYYMVIACPALALLLANAILSDVFKRQKIKLWVSILTLFSIASVTSIAIASHVAKGYEDKFSLKSMAQTLKRNDPQLNEKNIYFFQNYERISSLRFYLDQPISLIDSRSKDLWYGSRFKKNIFLTDQEFDSNTMNKDFYIVVRERELPKFYKKFPRRKSQVKEVFSKWAVLIGY